MLKEHRLKNKTLHMYIVHICIMNWC